jgi:hypothetical protein
LTSHHTGVFSVLVAPPAASQLASFNVASSSGNVKR